PVLRRDFRIWGFLDGAHISKPYRARSLSISRKSARSTVEITFGGSFDIKTLGFCSPRFGLTRKAWPLFSFFSLLRTGFTCRQVPGTSRRRPSSSTFTYLSENGCGTVSHETT